MAQSYGGDYGSNASENIKNRAGEAMDKARNTAGDLADTARQKASDAAQMAAEKGGELAERLQQSTVYNSLCRMAREQPLATLAGAVGIGFMAGALWKLSRSQSTTDRIASQVSSYVEPHLRSWRKSMWG